MGIFATVGGEVDVFEAEGLGNGVSLRAFSVILAQHSIVGLQYRRQIFGQESEFLHHASAHDRIVFVES